MGPLRPRLARGLGLRARMTASYVLVTFAAVVVVEALAAAVVIPNVNREADLASRVVDTANQTVKRYGQLVAKATAMTADPSLGLPAAKIANGAGRSIDQVAIELMRGTPLGEPGLRLRPGEVLTGASGVRIPHVDARLPDAAPMSLLLLLNPRGIVYGSSYTGRYVPGWPAADRLPQGWNRTRSAVSQLADGRVVWASEAIAPPSDDSEVAAPMAYVYVQVPIPAGGALDPAALEPLLRTGAVILLVSIPVGVLFGTLTTRGTVRRLRRLAAGTVGFAEGDFSRRVPESGADEVGQLERHFNGMAERLSASIGEQRALAERNARLAERTRISRELHDSISQDLFSISALAAGLRRALPASSPVQPQLETLSRTVGSTIQEMRALLLELRPSALEEQGLVRALADLCESYEVRVGVVVRHDLEPVAVDAAGEQALFRIAQEGLSNAVRHSEADRVDVRLRRSPDGAELTVADRGRGFDPGADAHGLGLRLMAERVRELGGTLAVGSGPGRGTELRVTLPGAGAG